MRRSTYPRHVLAKPLILVLDLVRELPRVAQHQHGHVLLGNELLQRRQHEDRRLAHARLCLAEHVHGQDGLSLGEGT